MKYYAHLELNAKNIWQALNTQRLLCLRSLAAMAGIFATLCFGILLIETAL